MEKTNKAAVNTTENKPAAGKQAANKPATAPEQTDEFITFTTTTRDGREIEMAVVDEFEFKNKLYAVAALVENDTISGDGRFIFRCEMKDDEDVTFEKITNSTEYQIITKAYLEIEE